MYRIKKVDGFDDDIAAEVKTLHDATFGDSAPQVTEGDLDTAHWWLVYFGGKEPVGFAGLTASNSRATTGYLFRSGVMPIHRGHGLQLRLVRAREQQAKKLGWAACISDTTDNPASSNTLIRAGYRLYEPERPWGFSNTLYWEKRL